MTIDVIPTGVALGAEIRGVDLSQRLTTNVFTLIERGSEAHGATFFRRRKITPRQQVAFTGRFGHRVHHSLATTGRSRAAPKSLSSAQRHRER